MVQRTSEKISELGQATSFTEEPQIPVIFGGATYRVTQSTLLNAYMPQVSTSYSGAVNTAVIQAAIDLARASYLAGRGIVEVVLPEGNFALAASTLSETYWNYGVSVAASEGCLSLRDGVRLRGAGVGKTVLLPASPTLSAIHVVDGNNQTVRDIEVNGGWTSTGAGHGILQVTATNNTATTVENLTIEDFYAHDVGSYGIGLENGVFTNVLIRNFRTRNTGADGIDIKNRPLPANVSRGLTLENLYIENPGRRLDGQTGVDIRGIVHASNITVVGVGRTGVEMNGIRMRTYGADEGWGDRSSLTNFYVAGADPTYTVTGGVQSGSANVTISNGVVENCLTGVWMTGNGSAQADNNSVVGVVVIGSNTHGFRVETAIDHLKWIGCTAVSCGVGFRNEGQNTCIIGCSAPGSTTPRSTSAGALQSEMLIEGGLQVDMLATVFLTTGRVGLEARGTSADIDIAISPKGAGLVRVGTHTLKGAEAFTGYITIKDSGGVSRKVMVCS